MSRAGWAVAGVVIVSVAVAGGALYLAARPNRRRGLALAGIGGTVTETTYRRSYAKAIRVAERVIGRGADAEDAVADAGRKMLEVERAGERFDNPEQFFLTATRNNAIDAIRRYGRRGRVVPVEPTEAEIKEGAAQVPSPLPSPEDAARAAQVTETERGVVHRMSARRRQIYELHRAGWEQADIAVEVAASQPTVSRG